MKYSFLLTCIWLSTVSLSYSDNTTPMESMLNESIPWKLKSDEDNLKIHFRFLRNEENEETRQLKCSSKSKTRKDILSKALRDPNLPAKWLARVEHCEILDGDNENEWYTYLLFDFPWPMSKRDILIKNKLIETNGETLIQMSTEKNRISKKEGIERMKGFFGYWKLSSTNHVLEYSIYSNVKSKVPTWVTDPFIEQSLVNSFSKLQAILEENSESL